VTWKEAPRRAPSSTHRRRRLLIDQRRRHHSDTLAVATCDAVCSGRGHNGRPLSLAYRWVPGTQGGVREPDPAAGTRRPASLTGSALPCAPATTAAGPKKPMLPGSGATSSSMANAIRSTWARPRSPASSPRWPSMAMWLHRLRTRRSAPSCTCTGTCWRSTSPGWTLSSAPSAPNGSRSSSPAKRSAPFCSGSAACPVSWRPCSTARAFASWSAASSSSGHRLRRQPARCSTRKGRQGPGHDAAGHRQDRLACHLETARAQHQDHLAVGAGWVELPTALLRNIRMPAGSGRGNRSSLRRASTVTGGRGSAVATTRTSRSCNAPSRTPSAERALPSAAVPIPCDTLLRHTCWRMATTSAPFKSFSGTAM
jgi:hypothetical protein